MFFSRVLQNIQKIKYTNNNICKKHEYIYYKLIKNVRYKNNNNKNIRHKNKNKNNALYLQSNIIPVSYRLSKLIEYKNSNLINYTPSNIKNVKNVKYNTIVYSIIAGTSTLLLVSCGIYSYIVIKHIDLLFCF